MGWLGWLWEIAVAFFFGSRWRRVEGAFVGRLLVRELDLSFYNETLRFCFSRYGLV